MDGHFLLNFPAEERQTAIRTKEFRFLDVSESVMDLEEITADLALDL
jgi:hypothetical protein